MCGGNHSGYKHDCFHLNITTVDWELHRSKMTENRGYASSVVHNGEMVVMGGVSSNTVELYKNGNWSMKDTWSLPKAKYAFCTIAYGKYIYQIGGGGLTDGGVVRLNTETNTYEAVPSIPSGQRQYHQCLRTTIKGEDGILITGSWKSDKINVVEFLTIPNHQWTEMGSLRQGRALHGLEIINNKPTVFGGYDNQNRHFLDDFEYYDEDSNTWHTIQNVKLTQPKRAFAYIRVNVEINN